MHGISRLALFSALGATAIGAPTWAQQTDDIVLDPITVIASSEPVAVGNTGATVTIVDEDDLANAVSQSAASQLARLPGVSLSRNGGPGTRTTLRLRGLSGLYIGVRIDGIDVSDTAGTQVGYDFKSTTTGGLSRIEVLRGSQSALFGSEAIGGVIDITTFRLGREGVGGQVGIEAGSDATYAGTASVGMKTDRVELAFSLSRTVTDGISAYAFGTEDDAFRATTLSFYGSYAVTDALTLGLNGIYRDSYAEFDYPPADDGPTELEKLRGTRAFAMLDAGAVQHELSFARTTTERSYPGAGIDFYEGKRDQLAYAGRLQATDQLSLNWGLDRTEETFAAGGDQGRSRTVSALTEVLYAPTSDLDLSLALRHDDHSLFGGQTSGRAALAWRPSSDWVIRAVVGTGFRAPSLFELFSIYGSPTLQPEQSRSLELGAEYILPQGGSLQATLFDTRIEDKIGFFVSSYSQIPGTTQTRGIELIGRAEIAGGWEVFGNYTFTDAELVSPGGAKSNALQVPKHDVVLGVKGRFGRWETVASVQHVSKRNDLAFGSDFVATPVNLAAYTLTNLDLSYEITDMTVGYLRVENLFDEKYQTVANYGQPGRSVFVGLAAKF